MQGPGSQNARGFAVDIFRQTALPLIFTALAFAAEAGTIIVNGDEWALSNPGFFNAPEDSVERFVSNLVSEFGPRIHAYSTSFAYTQSDLAAAMTRAGAEFSTGMDLRFSLPDLLEFDALMLGSDLPDAGQLKVLHAYVAAGGSLYISAGTGAAGSTAEEAESWNGFLKAYGLELAPSFSGFFGLMPMRGDRIFDGVEALYIGNPNPVSQGAVCCEAGHVFGIRRAAGARKMPAQ